MRPLLLLTAAVVAAIVAGCGGGATTNCKVPPDRALLLAVRAHAGPVVLPTGEKPGNAGRLTISACQTSATAATATLTVFGISGGPTRDMRHGMTLERRGTSWTVTADAHSRRCRKGAPSQEFSSARCP